MKKLSAESISLRLPPQLSDRRKEFLSFLEVAHARLENFALKHGLKHLLEESFCDCWEVFDCKAEFDHRLCCLFELPENTQLPVTYSAALEKKILFSITPEIYHLNYPQGNEPEAFAKLLCHEMAHRLHIRILNGNEAAMGPVWFYEGFALYVADQFINEFKGLSSVELRQLFNEQQRGDYRRYAHAFRQLAERAGSLADFLSWPEKTDFNQRLDSIMV